MSTHDRARGGTGKAEAMSPVRLVLPVQWGEMDAYGHVNNVVYFRWFESARMAYFARLGWPEVGRATGVGPILHSTRARFRAPLEWPDEVEVTFGLKAAGEAGNFAVAKVGAEASYTVTLKWKREEEKKGSSKSSRRGTSRPDRHGY